ncbi:MAG: hypothetical protein M3T56_14375 [Chloroflexota bacterium]|nr:hypothetical protein [Chloroflexota bacterium]
MSTEVLIQQAAKRPDFAAAVGNLGGTALVFDARPAEWHVAIPITEGASAKVMTGG